MIRNVGSRTSSELISNRLLNIVVAAVLLIVVGPLLVLIALAIRWETTGPVLDRRTSINREGHTFVALTFRITEQDRGRIWSHGNVTRVGWFLLYTRMVSLPQLINAVRGDISLFEMEDHSS